MITNMGVSKIGTGWVWLALFFLVFAGGAFLGGPVLVLLIDALSSTPRPLVVVLSWLPFGLMMLFFLADAMSTTAPPMRRPWVNLIAVTGLVGIAELTVIMRRPPSAALDVAASTATGQALVAGFLGSVGAVFLYTFVFQSARWISGRVCGEKVRFSDDSWGHQPKRRRRFVVGATATSLLGLVVGLMVV